MGSHRVGSHLHVPNVTSPLQKIGHMQSHLSVQNVKSEFFKVVVLKPIKGSLEQRSHLPVPNVACHLHRAEF